MAPAEGSIQPIQPLAEEVPGPPAVTPSLLEVPNGTALDAWLDLPHAFLERRIVGIVNGFDHFFADERPLACGRSSSLFRARQEVRVEKDGALGYGTTFRADLALPYLERRLKDLRIVLEDAGSGLFASEPKALTGQEDGRRGDAVLRVTLLDSLRSSLSLGGGVLLTLPPGLVGRLRFRHTHELGRVALARIAATGFWNTDVGFGSNASLALERSLARRLLLRWTTGTLVTQASHGYESGSELALLANLGRTTGLTLLGSVAAVSKPEPTIERWRVAARLRTSLLRDWILGEVEPEVAWPLDPAGGRRPVPAVMFRLEIQFEAASAKSPVAAGGTCGLASGNGRPKGGA